MSHPHDTVHVQATLSHPLVRTQTPEQVFLRIDVSSPAVAIPGRRGATSPLDLALVLDRSGSMHGEKLFYAKEAVRGLIDRLPATDSLSLCAYDDRIDAVFPRHPLDALVMHANAATIGSTAAASDHRLVALPIAARQGELRAGYPSSSRGTIVEKRGGGHDQGEHDRCRDEGRSLATHDAQRVVGVPDVSRRGSRSTGARVRRR